MVDLDLIAPAANDLHRLIVEAMWAMFYLSSSRSVSILARRIFKRSCRAAQKTITVAGRAKVENRLPAVPRPCTSAVSVVATKMSERIATMITAKSPSANARPPVKLMQIPDVDP